MSHGLEWGAPIDSGEKMTKSHFSNRILKDKNINEKEYMNRIHIILKFVKNYPAIRKCKIDAINLKNEGCFKSVPVQLGLINNIINNPEKSYEEYKIYDNMDEYVDYITYTDQSAS